MLVNNSEELKKLLESNTTFKQNFEKLNLAFENRIWTEQTSYLFKVLIESLFKDYGIPIICHTKQNMYGDGKFTLEFIE